MHTLCRSTQSHASRPEFSMHAVERRMHCSVTTWTSDSISDLSFDLVAQVQFGDNGDEWGFATATAGDCQTDAVTLFPTWGSASGALDSGWRQVSFAVNESNNGSASWSIANGGSGSFAAGTSMQIDSVTIRAAVRDSGMLMAWSDLTVRFYVDGSLGETIYVGGLSANTLALSNHVPRESVAVVTPTGSGYNGVEVVGDARLQANSGVYPGPNDIFGQILIG